MVPKADFPTISIFPFSQQDQREGNRKQIIEPAEIQVKDKPLSIDPGNDLEMAV